MRTWSTLICAFLFFACQPALAAYRVELVAPDPLKKLLAAHLDIVRYQNREDLNDDQFNYMLATVDDQVVKLAATEGYFSTKSTVKRTQEDDITVVHLTVEAGPRTTVSAVNLQVTGAARDESPSQAAQVHQTWSLTAGEPFRQEDWADAKQNGLRILQTRRYPAARIADSSANIYPDRHQAELGITYESGPLFTLGQVRITGTKRYPETIIRNINPLHIGEEYSVQRLLEFQRQIQRTPYFSNVVIDIDENPDNAKLAPVQVRVTEFPTQRIRAGVGYATDTGAHVLGSYSHYNVFNRAWIFDSQIRLEQQRQSGSIELSMPPDSGAFVNSAHAGIERTTLEGVDLRSRRLGLSRTRHTDRIDLGYTLDYYSDELQQLSGATLPPDTVVQPGRHQALVAGIATTHRDIDDPLFPRHGHIVSLEAGFAVKGLLTDQTFFRAYSRLRQYWPVGERDLVILRGELGAVISKGGNASIPASLLFRAGGTESIRGYAYHSIGNESNGVVYPTRYLATGGLEYQHWYTAKWGGAVFYDAGTATDNWTDKAFFQSVGIGVRWRSPVGAINADLAYGLERGSIRPHFSLGVAF